MTRQEAIEWVKFMREQEHAKSALSSTPCNTEIALQIAIDALELLKDQDERYKTMVVEWLREMAYNNYQETRKMDFLDAILEIRERAMIGLENYFRD